MFNEYYYSNKFKEPIYCSIITLNNAVETTLYIGNKLARRKSLQRGFHVLSKDDVKLKLRLKWLKAIPEFWIDNQKVVFQKLKRKELRKELKRLNIHNEINPRERPRAPYDYRQLITPTILIFCGIIWQLLTTKLGNSWWIPSALFLVIGYFQIVSPLIDKIPDRHIPEETRVQLKLILSIVSMILTQ